MTEQLFWVRDHLTADFLSSKADAEYSPWFKTYPNQTRYSVRDGCLEKPCTELCSNPGKSLAWLLWRAAAASFMWCPARVRRHQKEQQEVNGSLCKHYLLVLFHAWGHLCQRLWLKPPHWLRQHHKRGKEWTSWEFYGSSILLFIVPEQSTWIKRHCIETATEKKKKAEKNKD